MIINYQIGDQGQLVEDALDIRRRVFIEEQAVSEDIEYDGLDHLATHFVGYFDGKPICTARLIEDPAHVYHLQRVATLKDYRSQGRGQKLLLFIEDFLRSDQKARIWLGAQEAALDFYEKLGYSKYGESFMEAGIPHQHMEKYL